MASVHREIRNGRVRYRLQFYDKNNRRRSIRLGNISRKGADAICVKVEHLVSASVSGTPLDNETSRWVAGLGEDLARKLSKVGLIEAQQATTIAKFIDEYIDSRMDASPNTVRNLRNSRDKLVVHFGNSRSPHQITPGDADDWRQCLVNKGLSEATISKAVKHAKQFFRLALRRGLVNTNPFADLKAGSDRISSRLVCIDRESIDRVIAAAPDAEWRLIIALARYGGLRTPSETLALEWSHVNWAESKLTVPSQKTGRLGKPYRVVPLFPELRPLLQDAFDQAPEGTVTVIRRYRRTNANLRTQFERIIRRAGIKPWPRLFHNLRASRQTELADDYPLHVVADWIGNTPEIADRHYLKTVERHFQKAIRGGATGGAMMVQQSVPHATTRDRLESQESSEDDDGCNVTLLGANLCDSMLDVQAPPRGVEPLSSD